MKKILSALAVLGLFLITQPIAHAGTEQELNKKIVTEFYQAAINQKDFAAASKYLGTQYRQHNPLAADGPAGLRAYLQFLKEKFPASHSEIKKVFADGDYVILHVHAVRVPGTRGNAVVDIFRLENGKVEEHWDVIQEIPEKSANGNGMF
jgi:predicted SnoaL-like aldol condensation-catalyzing enzyme